MSETLSHVDLDSTATALAAAVAARKVSAAELTDAAIARIEQRDTVINAVVVRDFDRARAAAKAADAALAKGARGPLLGVPMTVKESFNIAGLPTTWGSEGFRGWTADEDSVVVERLKGAGAVLLGKTNVPPMLSDFQTNNPIYGRTVNPWDPTRSAGGSSGGSGAALAAGMSALEVGSDIGGSIRIPAALCGVYGHKPSYNLVPSRGHTLPGFDGAPVPLAVCGPLARSAADLDLALDVIAGPDEMDAVGYRLALPPPRHDKLGDYRVLMLDALGDAPLDSEVRAALDGLAGKLEALGATVSRKTDALPDAGRSREVFMGILNTAMSRGSPGARPMDAHAYMALLDGQLAIRRQWAEVFKDVDIVLSPVFATTAFPHVDEPDWSKRTLTIDGKQVPYAVGLAWPATPLLGNLPATAFPVGLSKGGLPIGLQAIGPYLEDRTTIGFAGLVEREFGGFKAPPAL